MIWQINRKTVLLNHYLKKVYGPVIWDSRSLDCAFDVAEEEVLYFLSIFSIVSDWFSGCNCPWAWAVVWDESDWLMSSLFAVENETVFCLLLLDVLFDLNGIKEKRFFFCWFIVLVFLELLDEFPEKIFFF